MARNRKWQYARRGILSEEVSIYTAETTAMREIKKRVQDMGNIYRLTELKSDI